MSVSKFRSVADMPPAALPVDANIADRIRALWRRAFLLSPPTIPRGVERFRNMTEANDARTRATRARMAMTRDCDGTDD